VDLEAAFIRACALDVEILKPGNVSLASPGHGMTGAQFLASAAAAAPAICAPGVPVGRRILEAVEASWAAAHCNTNLGILLLCAPVAAAVERAGGRPFGQEPCAGDPARDEPLERTLRRTLERTLQALTVDDACNAFRAIALANPGGLGSTDEQDVHEAATVSLLDAMGLAADRDLIARQYATGYADLFESGLAAWKAGLGAAGGDRRHAMQCAFLWFLARFPDSHIVRKHGTTAAQAVSDEAAIWFPRVVVEGPSAQPGLLEWDGRLKAAGLNPGTSADLAVATAFVDEALVILAGLGVSRSGPVATRAG
jgi:triphosphoribosyl-dephospho-CoA synthase